MKACLESETVYRSRERIMPKMKTHSGAKKRFSVTGSGKIRRLKAYKSHILTKKDPDRKSTRLNSSHSDLSRMPSSA